MKICDMCRQSGTTTDAGHELKCGVHSFDLCNEHLQQLLKLLQQPATQPVDKPEARNPKPEPSPPPRRSRLLRN